MDHQLQFEGIDAMAMEPPAAVIGSVFYSQRELLGSLIQLYGSLELDCTWSTGAFWEGLPAPSIRSDLRATGNVVADFTALPFASRSIRSMIIDPPFLHDSGSSAGVISERFSSYRTQADLRVAYHGALVEARRVLLTGGILIFKTQDIVEHDRNVWNHCYVMSTAEMVGFEVLDLAILVTNTQLTGWNYSTQVHLRKMHCYFLVMRKTKRV